LSCESTQCTKSDCSSFDELVRSPFFRHLFFLAMCIYTPNTYSFLFLSIPCSATVLLPSPRILSHKRHGLSGTKLCHHAPLRLRE
jgi:hypothetical protein